MDDEALVSQARSGNMTAVGELLERYQDVAYTAALRLVGPSDAEDIAQEALVRAYTRLSELREGASFGGWVRRIAVNLSLNVLRRRGLLTFESLERVQTDGVTVQEFADDKPSPEDEAISGSTRDEIDRLVRELPIEQRVAVVLRDMYGFEVAEVAALQRCGISAAKMRISRGREQLRRRITTLRADEGSAGADRATAARRPGFENE